MWYIVALPSPQMYVEFSRFIIFTSKNLKGKPISCLLVLVSVRNGSKQSRGLAASELTANRANRFRLI